MESSFRRWANESRRADIRAARLRILLIFLLIRYTGAKLNEVLELAPQRDIDYKKRSVFFRGSQSAREVQISEALSVEIQSLLSAKNLISSEHNTISVDAGFVRRKFYERAYVLGLPKKLSGPEMIRKARGAELMQANMPLTAVQALLGHSTPNLTSSYVSFTKEEISRATRYYMEKESARKTSARNFFYGKVSCLKRGDIQSEVKLSTVEGHTITTIITNDSAGRLGLKIGKIITAEIKAPWVILQKGDEEIQSSAENIFRGTIVKINSGSINTEYIIRVSDNIELCSIVTTQSGRIVDINKGDHVWVLFNAYAVVLHVD